MRTQTEAYHDDESRNYDAKYDAIPFFVKLYEPVTWDNMCRFLPPPPAKILDAGGGTGRWALPLAEKGYEVTLTDISNGMLEIARRRAEEAGLAGRVTILRQDIRDMRDLPDARFDYVLAQGDPVGYCGDHRAAIRELARVAKKGAPVDVSVDSRIQALGHMSRLELDEALKFLETGETRWSAENEEHRFPIHAFTVSELAALFEESGLQVRRVIGKPVFFQRLRPEAQERILADEEATRRFLEIELQYCDDPGWAGSAGHIEIVGIKIRYTSLSGSEKRAGALRGPREPAGFAQRPAANANSGPRSEPAGAPMAPLEHGRAERVRQASISDAIKPL